MKFKKEHGVTMTMLVITIVVMLIISVVLINATVGNNDLLNNSKNVKFKEEVSSIKSKYYEKATIKQEIEGVPLEELDSEELRKILEKILEDHPKYTTADFSIREGSNVLVYRESSFSPEEKRILNTIEIPSSN